MGFVSTRCSWLRMPSDTHTDRHCWGHSGAAPIWACLGWAGGAESSQGSPWPCRPGRAGRPRSVEWGDIYSPVCLGSRDTTQQEPYNR